MSSIVELNLEADVASETESLCTRCGKNGVTKMLFSKIPYFRDVVLMAFECPHCGFRNMDLESASEIAEKGIKFELHVAKVEDLNRQVVKSDTATIFIPQIQLEIPPVTQKGSVNTIEGVLSAARDSLSLSQSQRQIDNPQAAEKIEVFLRQLDQLLAGATQFTFVLDDPSGNSFLENPNAPHPDPRLIVTHYARTPQQDQIVHGRISADTDAQSSSTAPASALSSMGGGRTILTGDDVFYRQMKDEIGDVLEFPVNCPSCSAPGVSKMYVCDIPHFKETIIMAFLCDYCGYKDTETKASAEVSEHGIRYSLKCRGRVDFARDFLKSDTCAVDVPELELHLTPGTLGGMFTSVEGFLTQCYNSLVVSNPFVYGDSADVKRREEWEQFCDKLKQVSEGTVPCTLIASDPLANSYIQFLTDDPKDDEWLRKEEYERTEEENDELGIETTKEAAATSDTTD